MGEELGIDDKTSTISSSNQSSSPRQNKSTVPAGIDAAVNWIIDLYNNGTGSTQANSGRKKTSGWKITGEIDGGTDDGSIEINIKGFVWTDEATQDPYDFFGWMWYANWK